MEKSELSANIDKEAFLKCYDLIWSKMTLLYSVQAGTFTGWYLLFKENEKLISIFLLLLSILLIYIIYLIIRRLTFIQERHRLALEEIGVMQQPKTMPTFSVSDKTLFYRVLKTPPYGHRLAKAPPLMLILFNQLLLAFTLYSMLPQDFMKGLIISSVITMLLGIVLWIAIDFKNIVCK